MTVFLVGVYKQHFFVWFNSDEGGGDDLRGDCHIMALIYLQLLFRTHKKGFLTLYQKGRIAFAFYDNEGFISTFFSLSYLHCVMSCTSPSLMFLLLRCSRNPSLVGHLCCIKHPLGLSSPQALTKHFFLPLESNSLQFNTRTINIHTLLSVFTRVTCLTRRHTL